MGFSTEELAGGITRVILDGRLDIQGAAAVDLKMNVIAGSKKTVLLDLQNVSFLGSMGLRSLVIPARAIKSRGGKMVIFGPNQLVEEVLKTSSVDTLIPIHHDLESAMAALR
jgi:anti-sigma B factor antagonist